MILSPSWRRHSKTTYESGFVHRGFKDSALLLAMQDNTFDTMRTVLWRLTDSYLLWPNGHPDIISHRQSRGPMRWNDSTGLCVDQNIFIVDILYNPLEHIGSTEEFRDKLVARILVNLCRRTDLNKSALVHHSDPRGKSQPPPGRE